MAASGGSDRRRSRSEARSRHFTPSQRQSPENKKENQHNSQFQNIFFSSDGAVWADFQDRWVFQKQIKGKTFKKASWKDYLQKWHKSKGWPNQHKAIWKSPMKNEKVWTISRWKEKKENELNERTRFSWERYSIATMELTGQLLLVTEILYLQNFPSMLNYSVDHWKTKTKVIIQAGVEPAPYRGFLSVLAAKIPQGWLVGQALVEENKLVNKEGRRRVVWLGERRQIEAQALLSHQQVCQRIEAVLWALVNPAIHLLLRWNIILLPCR